MNGSVQGNVIRGCSPIVQQRLLRGGGWFLPGVGLLGHLYAANAIGGSRIAYTHHVFGFGLILVVTGGIIVGLGVLALAVASRPHAVSRRPRAGAPRRVDRTEPWRRATGG